MFPAKPTARFMLSALSIILLLSFTVLVTANEDPNIGTENDGNDDELGELTAIYEQEEEQEFHQQQQGFDQQKEAEVLSKAQRIVLELNSDNVMRVISENEFVMILGYAPWCSRSAEPMPHFAEAANKLKDLGSPVLMAKLDAERYPKAASTLEIKGFPTLLLFVNGSSIPYTGGYTGEDIVIWTRKKTGYPVIRLSSVTEAEEFVGKSHIFVVGLFEKPEGPNYEEFVKAARMDNEIQFVEVSSNAVAKILFPDIKAANQFIGLVKSEPERYTTYEGMFKMDNILQFIENNKFPRVTKLRELNSVRVFSSPVKLQSLTVSNFYVGKGSDFSGVPTKMLTVNGTLRMSIYNPATIFGIHVSSTPINLIYSKIPIATGQLKKYYQPRKSRRTVSVIVEGNKVPLYGAGSGLKISQTGVVIPVTLTFEICSKGDVVGTNHRTHVSCSVVLDSTRNKPMEFKKGACTYD